MRSLFESGVYSEAALQICEISMHKKKEGLVSSSLDIYYLSNKHLLKILRE